MRPGIYDARHVHRQEEPEPIAVLHYGVRIQLTDRSYLTIALDADTGELRVHASGTGLEHLVTTAGMGGVNSMNLRVELRSGSIYAGQAPEPEAITNARDRLDELASIRVALQNAAQKHTGGITPEEAGKLAERLHGILTTTKGTAP